MTRVSENSFEEMLPFFRMAAVFRNEANKAGCNDNRGAIHSAARILEIMALGIKYPGLTHVNHIRKYSGAEFSVKARVADEEREKTHIEHVSPVRHFTQMAIQRLITEKCSDDEFKEFVRENYRLVILTKDEAKNLDRKNRTKMAPKRLEEAGIELANTKPNGVRN